MRIFWNRTHQAHASKNQKYNNITDEKIINHKYLTGLASIDTYIIKKKNSLQNKPPSISIISYRTFLSHMHINNIFKNHLTP